MTLKKVSQTGLPCGCPTHKLNAELMALACIGQGLGILMRRIRLWRSRCLVALLLVSSTGCALLLPGHFWRLTGSSDARIPLVADSQMVRQVIAEEDSLEWLHPEQYPSGRANFLAVMAQLPRVSVPGRSYCEVLERSKSTCGASPIETATYVFVQITTGRSRGQKGWVCENVVHQLFP